MNLYLSGKEGNKGRGWVIVLPVEEGRGEP